MSHAAPTTGRGPRFERPGPLVRPADLRRDVGPTYLANAVIGLVFSATGPLAVILASGRAGNLDPAQLTSWIFGAFFLNGLLTLVMSALYRQPLAFFWTIPGTIVVGGSLSHLSWPQVLGSFVVTGVLLVALGLSGWVSTVMRLLPMPIVMAMVAGVFLRFGVALVGSLESAPLVAIPMVLAFVLLSRVSAWSRWMPPVLGTLLVGVLMVVVTGQWGVHAPASLVARPLVQAPSFSVAAVVELVLPLLITVIVVQNGQGIAVLTAAGHRPPINVCTLMCGVWSLLCAAIGTVSTSLTGPTNALLTASGQRQRQYVAGIACGVGAMVVGAFAPVLVAFMLGLPVAWIAVLGGVAMLRPLQAAFVTAFSTRCTLGALVAFLVTVADLSVFNIGGAFWGVVLGYAVSRVLESRDVQITTGPERG